jgi:hypothetical protein
MQHHQHQDCLTLSSSVLKAFMLAAGVGPPFLRASHLVNTMPKGTCSTHTPRQGSAAYYMLDRAALDSRSAVQLQPGRASYPTNPTGCIVTTAATMS